MLERMAAARRAGFAAFEVQFPYEIALEDWVAARRKAAIATALINVPSGDFRAGGPGLAAMPGREAAFREAVGEARRYARGLRARCVNVLAGTPPPGLGRERYMAVLAQNLRHAAAVMAEIGVRVVVEAVNTRDRPDFFLPRTRDALAAIDWAGHDNLFVQYDLYHAQIMEGDLVPTLEAHIGRIGHIQFADTPGRHEPGTGEINFPFVFAAIDRLGYDGWVGAEYLPSRPTGETLEWLAPWRVRRGRRAAAQAG